MARLTADPRVHPVTPTVVEVDPLVRRIVERVLPKRRREVVLPPGSPFDVAPAEGARLVA